MLAYFIKVEGSDEDFITRDAPQALSAIERCGKWVMVSSREMTLKEYDALPATSESYEFFKC